MGQKRVSVFSLHLRVSPFSLCLVSILIFLLSFFTFHDAPCGSAHLLFTLGADLPSTEEKGRVSQEGFFPFIPVTSSLLFSLLSGTENTQERGVETPEKISSSKEWMQSMTERTTSPSSSSSSVSMIKPVKKLSRRDLEVNVRRSLGSLVEDVFQILIQNLKKVLVLPPSSYKDKRTWSLDTQEQREEGGEEGQDFPLKNTKIGRYYAERFPNEPDDVRELFPLLLDDKEAYSLWKSHFTRHLISRLTDRMVKDLSKGIKESEGGDQREEEREDKTDQEGVEEQEDGEEQGFSTSPNHRLNLLDVVFLEAKKVFWDSRPASSQAAVILINRRMKELRQEHQQKNFHKKHLSQETEERRKSPQPPFPRHLVHSLQRETDEKATNQTNKDNDQESFTSSSFMESPPLSSRPLPSWIAEVSPRFRTLSIRDAKALMGTYLVHYPVQVEGKKIPVKPVSLPPRSYASSSSAPLPDEFDSREAFPYCKDVIGHVRDQGDCGSCWAFASTEALNDRVCIKSQGKAGVSLSAQHTTSCCNAIHCASFGCNGGQPGMAWRWFQRNGVVTGGDYETLNEGKTCWPYEIPNCAHHAKAPFPDCDSGVLPKKTPKCRKECEEQDYTTHVHPFKEDLHRAASSYSLRSREDIKRDMINHGSVTGAFMVYEDFLNYKSGVYTHVTGMPIGGHAVKILGWGSVRGRAEQRGVSSSDGGVEYWLGVNSWNEYWGDEGTFKIQMGQAGIDDEVVAGEALQEVEKESVEHEESREEKVATISLQGTINLGVEKEGQEEEEMLKRRQREAGASAIDFLFYAEERVRDDGAVRDRKEKGQGQPREKEEEEGMRGRKKEEEGKEEKEDSLLQYEREM
ncbi:cathepsin b [Cystoisospora suis]|uniref:Cathepsin b n=1 Tax=Cystoisospora suis TaxID=483139 RepID=A0A2C6L240_9APIC|nr:cathepsin b [Cystoisospora suis]